MEKGIASMAERHSATKPAASFKGSDITADVNQNFIALNSDDNRQEKMNETETKNYESSDHVVSSTVGLHDVVTGLNWNNGIGVLPGTNMKFRINDVGDVEMMSDQEEEQLSIDDVNTKPLISAIGETNTVNDTERSGDYVTSSLNDGGSNDLVVHRNANKRRASKKAFSNSQEVVTENPIVVKKEKGFYFHEDSASSSQPAFTETNPTSSSADKLNIIQCAFCGISGQVHQFHGRFCTKQCVARNAVKCRQQKARLGLIGKKIERKRRNQSNPTALSISKENQPGNLKIKIRRNTSVVEDNQEYNPSVHKRRNTAVTAPRESKTNFSWKSYLAAEDAIEAPVEIFRKLTHQEPYPSEPNKFEVGWLLEAVDPIHQTVIALVSVSNIMGHRIRLHFEGYPSIYDFWTYANSPLIFPCGFCEKTGRRLSPPCDFDEENFNSKNYAEENGLIIAPEDIFKSASYENKTGFEIFDRIEAIDRHHPELICVASVTNTIGEYVLIHFDGWNSCYDYWILHTSNYIKPVGWCSENGKELTPWLGFDEKKTFSWKDYLNSNGYKAADPSLFSKDSHGFEVGMKLEVVDQRNQIVVRIGTISAKDDHRVQIHYDGWSDVYDVWMDADSRDLHPIDWCSKTKQELQQPPNHDQDCDLDEIGCPIPGCLGLGHVKHNKFLSHHSEFGCPYSPQNLHREPLPDRFIFDKISSHDDVIPDGNNNTKENATVVMRKKRGRPRGCSLLVQRDRQTSGENDRRRSVQHEATVERSQSRRKSSSVPDLGAFSSLCGAAFIMSITERQQLQREMSLGWKKHVLSLPGVKGKNANQVSDWSAEQVSSFVNQLTGKSDCGDVFVTQEIDGEAFLMLTQSDISSVLKVKLGPSVKIFNAILSIKTANSTVVV